jgi:peptidoglycan hydrolase-like protein with peptidoglycan-binding domain
MSGQSRLLNRIGAGIVTAVAAAGLALVPAGNAAAATPLCTTGVNVVRGSDNIAVPSTSGGNLTCLIGRTRAANSAVVRLLQGTLKTCYPTAHLAPPYQGELVGNLSVDGSFGPRTEAAMKGVQAYIGTSADGEYGPLTRDRMRFTSNDVPNRCVHY